MSTTHTLTGETQYRLQRRWFGAPVVVLQVAVREVGPYHSPDPHDHCVRDIDRVYWRDAMVQDLVHLAKLWKVPS